MTYPHFHVPIQSCWCQLLQADEKIFLADLFGGHSMPKEPAGQQPLARVDLDLEWVELHRPRS